MNKLPTEVEERYGVARGLMLPVPVSAHQLDMLRAAEAEADKGWNFMMLIFAGSKIVADAEKGRQRLRLPELRVPNTVLDLEEFEIILKAKICEVYNLEIDLSHYLLLAHCTFMSNSAAVSDESDTSSRTLHLFTARALNSDELIAREDLSSAARLVKPAVLSDSLQSEWADVRAQINSGGAASTLRDDYDLAWAFVRARLVATVFQHLFGWPLPEI